MCLITGDQITLASVGTATYLDTQGAIYGFGHPLIGSGKTECPFTSTEIMAEVSNKWRI